MKITKERLHSLVKEELGSNFDMDKEPPTVEEMVKRAFLEGLSMYAEGPPEEDWHNSQARISLNAWKQAEQIRNGR